MAKSQIRMGETMAVLFFVFVLVAVGSIVYFKMQASSAGPNSIENMDRQSIIATSNALYLPELECTFFLSQFQTFERSRVETACFDRLKLERFPELVAGHPDYYNLLFRNSHIFYNITYPFEMGKTIYGKQMQDATFQKSTTIPINIYAPLNKEYYYALLTVDYYSK